MGAEDAWGACRFTRNHHGIVDSQRMSPWRFLLDPMALLFLNCVAGKTDPCQSLLGTKRGSSQHISIGRNAVVVNVSQHDLVVRSLVVAATNQNTPTIALARDTGFSYQSNIHVRSGSVPWIVQIHPTGGFVGKWIFSASQTRCFHAHFTLDLLPKIGQRLVVVAVRRSILLVGCRFPLAFGLVGGKCCRQKGVVGQCCGRFVNLSCRRHNDRFLTDILNLHGIVVVVVVLERQRFGRGGRQEIGFERSMAARMGGCIGITARRRRSRMESFGPTGS
jgi:hypothetical protein